MVEKKLSIDDFEVGGTIKFGKEYCKANSFPENCVMEIVEGYFEEDNGLYNYTSSCPSIQWDEDDVDEYDSMYHLFGNDLDGFMDCEYIPPTDEKRRAVKEAKEAEQAFHDAYWDSIAKEYEDVESE